MLYNAPTLKNMDKSLYLALETMFKDHGIMNHDSGFIIGIAMFFSKL